MLAGATSCASLALDGNKHQLCNGLLHSHAAAARHATAHPDLGQNVRTVIPSMVIATTAQRRIM